MSDSRLCSDPLSGLKWPLRLTFLGLLTERVIRAFWPFASVVSVWVAGFAFGLGMVAQGWAFWAIAVGMGVCVFGALAMGLRRFVWPRWQDAVHHLDATLQGRPLSALCDRPALGSGGLWAAHIARMARHAMQNAKPPAPDVVLNHADPFALRYVAAVALAMAVLFGSFDRALGPQIPISAPGGAVAALGPSWEGWVEPPLYTGRPPVYLNDITVSEFDIPFGSVVTLRSYGATDAFRLNDDLGPLTAPPPEGDVQLQTLRLEQSGELRIGGPNGGLSWDVHVVPDAPPSVSLMDMPQDGPPGQMQIRFSAQDDYGVVSGRAVITVALDQVDRRYGLAADPDPRDPLVLDLPLPFNGSRDAFEQILQDDISQHPFANLPVHIALEVTDDAGNIGTSGHDIARLAGRRFFDPLANAVIELRRDMLWSSANIARSAQILRALTHIPEDDLSNGLNFALDDVIKQLESETPLSANQIDDIAVVLWTVALELEEGPTDDALERLRQAQERLNEAMQQGASQAEIDELMREMRRAMDDYLRELAENAAPPEDMTDQPQSPDDRMYMSMTDLQDMLRQIEDLMQQGRIAEAQQMMQALQDLLENMEMTQTNEPGQGDFPGQQSLENLQDTLRDQQQLSEDAFQDLQDQFGQGQNQGQPNPNQGRDQGNDQDGDQGGDQEGGQTLADRQQALREELENQIGELPGTGTQAGDQALEQLDQAGRAMQQAEDLLQQGDIAGALDQQSRAMDALRDGMTALDQALTDDRFGEAGQGDTARGAFSDADTALDPLGRRAGETASGSIDNQAGTVLPQDGRQTAQDLIEELRRRSGDQTRPQIELDYLRRLLDDF